MKIRRYSAIKEAANKNLPFLRLAMSEVKRPSPENRHRPRTESKTAGLIEFYSQKGRSMASFRDERTGMRMWRYPSRREKDRDRVSS